jgi:Porin subfamily
MKMVKSLLLGSAAGLVAVTTGQAADLPVKAKPVEYVKICSLYGAGFYYMPGTDLCLKVGGWARFEAVTGNTNGSPTWGAFAGNVQQRSTSNTVFRARGYITVDAREQTAYGTARGYLAVGLNTSDLGLNTAANQFSANRAFVQFAGFTGGITQSFYDYFSSAAVAYMAGYLTASDTGDPGWLVAGYTAQLGNGLSATLAMEARRITQNIDQNAVNGQAGAPSQFNQSGGGSIVPGSYFDALTAAAGGNTVAPGLVTVSGGAAILPGAGAYGGQQIGDIVANLRLDQAWGGAQIMGALHQVNASYYSSAATTTPSVLSESHPSDAWGYALGAGLRLNTPMFGAGDYIQTQANYTVGASRYIFQTPNSNWGKADGGSEAYGILSDCVYGGINTAAGPVATAGNTSCQLTTAWNIDASYEHHWSPAWQTSLYGSWAAVKYDSSANAMLCSAAGFGNAGIGTGAAANPGCNNDWTTWAVGSRTQWNVTKTFYMGVDVIYEQLKSATTGSASAVNALSGYAIGSATQVESTSGAWAFRFRAHKDFLP